MAAITMAKVNNATWSRSPDGWSILWSHIGHIPDLLAQVLLPLLTSGEMEGISGGAAGGDGCKEVGWSFPSST